MRKYTCSALRSNVSRLIAQIALRLAGADESYALYRDAVVSVELELANYSCERLHVD